MLKSKPPPVFIDLTLSLCLSLFWGLLMLIVSAPAQACKPILAEVRIIGRVLSDAEMSALAKPICRAGRCLTISPNQKDSQHNMLYTFADKAKANANDKAEGSMLGYIAYQTPYIKGYPEKDYYAKEDARLISPQQAHLRLLLPPEPLSFYAKDLPLLGYLAQTLSGKSGQDLLKALQEWYPPWREYQRKYRLSMGNQDLVLMPYSAKMASFLQQEKASFRKSLFSCQAAPEFARVGDWLVVTGYRPEHCQTYSERPCSVDRSVYEVWGIRGLWGGLLAVLLGVVIRVWRKQRWGQA